MPFDKLRMTGLVALLFLTACAMPDGRAAIGRMQV